MRFQASELPGPPPEGFLELPQRVYQSDPQWIPEDPQAVIHAFSLENGWFANGRAAAWCVPGSARLAVFLPAGLVVSGRPAAFFGFFEQAGGGDAASLLAQAEAWARAAGVELLIGPVDFSTAHRYRLRLSAEAGAETFLGEPYNPPHYPALLEAAGYHIVRRYLSQVGAYRQAPGEHKQAVHAGVLAAGYRFEPTAESDWLDHLAQFKALTDTIFAGNFGFTAEPLATYERGSRAAARRFCPRTSLLVRAPGGELVGFVTVYPQYARLVTQAAGAARISASDISYTQHWQRLERLGERTMVIRTIGVHPAHRSRGLMDALITELAKRARPHYDRWIGALIEESNRSRRFGDALSDQQRSYALVAKELRPDGGA